MPDVSDQLRAWSKALAQAVEPADVDTITSSTPGTGTTDTSSRRWLAAAASLLVIGAGIFAVATLGNDDPDRMSPATDPATSAIDNTTAPTQPTTSPTSDPDVVPIPQSTTPPTTTTTSTTTTASTVPANPDDRLEAWPAAPLTPLPVDDIPLLLPAASITTAGTPVRGQTEGGSAVESTYTQVFADADRDILFTLQTQPNSTESTPDDFRQPTTIEGWDEAFATEGFVRLVASDPSGYVRLTGTGLDNERAAQIIATMQRRPDGLAGWDLGAGADGLVEINGAWSDSAGQRSVTWFDGDRVVAQLLTSPAHTDLINQALSPSFDRVDVNGADGWLNAVGGRRSIVWSPDGTTVAVLGVVDDRIDPLAIAESVEEFDTTEYESRTTTDVPPGVGDGCDGDLFC